MRIYFLPLFALLLFSGLLPVISDAQDHDPNKGYFQLTPRVGFDHVILYNDGNPYINYGGGLSLGISADLYFRNRWGFGVDFDGLNSLVKNNDPIENLFSPGGIPLIVVRQDQDLTSRWTVGIRPNYFCWSANEKFVTELNLRAGLAYFESQDLFTEVINNDSIGLINYGGNVSNEDGYLTFKAQVRSSYYVNRWFGLHAGIQNFWHINVQQIPGEDFITSERVVYYEISELGNTLAPNPTIDDAFEPRLFSSLGIFAGLSIKLQRKDKIQEPATVIEPPVGSYILVIVAKDKFSQEILPNTDIITGDYSIESKLYEVTLESAQTEASEFKASEPLQKTVIYDDPNFIVQGKVFLL